MNCHRQEGLVFFTDISGFGKATGSMELEETAELITTYAEQMDSAADAAGGTLISIISDSALGYFPENSVDPGVLALLEIKAEIESWLKSAGHRMRLKIGAHYGEFLIYELPPYGNPDLLGDTVNTTVRLGAGGTDVHRNQMVLSATAFRKLRPETRKHFHKFTEPIVYIGEV